MVLSAAPVLALSIAAAELPGALRAGASTSNITPRLGTSINGGMRDRAAQYVHDELHARTLVLDDGTTRLAFVVCDSCMISRETIDAAKRSIEAESGLPAANVLVSATHTHSAPAACGVFQSDADADYLAFLARRIADGVRRAIHDLRPARVGWGTAQVPEHVFNRRWHLKPGTIPPGPFPGNVDLVKMNPGRASPDLVEPAGPTDPTLSIVSVVTAEGKPLALVANYSLHYVGGTGPGAISADYYGRFCARVGDLLAPRAAAEPPGDAASEDAPPFVAMLTNGTSGDVNNIDFRIAAPGREPYEQIRIVAESVAQEAVRLARTIEHRGDVTLAARARELELAVRRPTADEVASAKPLLEVARAEGRDLRALEEIYARETVLLADYPARVPLVLQALRIGDLGIAAIPCEVFVETGLELRRRSPLAPMFTISLANGYNGYLPTPRHHALGGYETWRARSSYLEVEASEKIVATLDELLRALPAGESGTGR